MCKKEQNIMTGRLFIISGSSGVGKGTVIKKFLEKAKGIYLSVSTTTRKPREGEEHGKNYFFVTREDFEKDVDAGNFLEHAEFGGNLYGTNKNTVEKMLKDGKNVLLEIEVQGAKQVKEKLSDTVTIFILPPSLEEIEKRLRGRGTESEEAIQKRLQSIAFELKESEHYDYKVVNDFVERAADEILKIYEDNRG
jgi:guanylate kinase